MKSLKTKVIMSAVVLAFALLATIGSTYAWFTVSSTVSVNTVNIDVTTEESLLIRVWNEDDATVGNYTADDFFNVVNLNDPNGDGTPDGYYVDHNGGYTTWTMTPLTAATEGTVGETDYDGFDITNLQRMNLTPTTSRTYTAGVANTSAGGYIELKFWLMTQSGTNTTVELSSLTVNSTEQALEDALYFGTVGDGNQLVFPIDSDWGFEFFSTDTGYSATPALNTVEAASKTILTNLEKVPDTNNDIVITLDTADTPELVTVYIWIEGWDEELQMH